MHFITNLTHIFEFQVISLWHLFPSFKWNNSLSGDSKPVNRGPGADTAEEKNKGSNARDDLGKGQSETQP